MITITSKVSHLIIKGYKKLSKKKSKVLVQKMISKINCSGVVFNKDLNQMNCALKSWVERTKELTHEMQS